MIKRYMWSFAEKFGQGLFVSDKGDYVKYEDYAELQQKLDEMAAENAALMKFCKNAAFDADYESELGMERGGFTDAVNDIKTPATDTYLNSVRAEGAIAVRNALVLADDGSDIYAIATDTAEQLRSGTHDTEDKAG